MATKASKIQVDREVRARVNGALVHPPKSLIGVPHPLALPLHTQVLLPLARQAERDRLPGVMSTDQLLPFAFGRVWPINQRAYASAQTLTELNGLLGADKEWYAWARPTSKDPLAVLGEVQSNVYRGYFRHHDGLVCTSTRALDKKLQRLPRPDRRVLTRMHLPARALFVCFGIGEWAFPWKYADDGLRVIDGAYVFANAATSPTRVSLGFTSRGTLSVDASMVELPPMELREDSTGEVLIEIDHPTADELYEDRWVNLAIDHVLKILLHLHGAKTTVALAGTSSCQVADAVVRPEERQYAWMIVERGT